MRMTFDLTDWEGTDRRFRPGCFDAQIGGTFRLFGQEATMVACEVVDEGRTARITAEVDVSAALHSIELEPVDPEPWLAGGVPLWFSRASLATLGASRIEGPSTTGEDAA